ncbi:MAG: damage-inducible protein CinA, partial [Bacteroidales bacterium]
NKALFASRGYPMTEINRQQAFIPACCEVIYNTCGTAPGMWFTQDGTIIVSMPGVPYEMKKMMELDILPRLKALIGNDCILHQTIMTHGLGESCISDKISVWED